MLWKEHWQVVMNVVFLEVEIFLKNSARPVVRAIVGGGAKEEHSVDVVKDAVRKGPDKKCEELDCSRLQAQSWNWRGKEWLTVERWVRATLESCGGRRQRFCGAQPHRGRDGRWPMGRAVRVPPHGFYDDFSGPGGWPRVWWA